METENGSRFGQEDHRAVRDVSEEKDGDNRSEGRFGGQNHQVTAPGGARRSGGGSDAIFTPRADQDIQGQQASVTEKTRIKRKISIRHQSKRTQTKTRRQKPDVQNPESTSVVCPQQKQEEKKPEIKEITIPEKLTIRELAKYEDAAICNC